MINQEEFASYLAGLFEKFGVKEIKTNNGLLGFDDDGEFTMENITIVMNKPNWYVKEKLKEEKSEA